MDRRSILLAHLAKVIVGALLALVTNSLDSSFASVTDGRVSELRLRHTSTTSAMMRSSSAKRASRSKDLLECVIGMNRGDILRASLAKIVIGALFALVSDTSNGGITSVARRMMNYL